MEWVRGETIGSGSFATVSMAKPKHDNNSTPIVVKYSEFSNSISLENEKVILSELGNNHPNIIHLLGDLSTCENGVEFYNLLLEYAKNGSLYDQLKLSGGKFKNSDVKMYTKSILQGLCYIHENGYVHCDIKLKNILLFGNGIVKIADFGLAKRVCDNTGVQFRGTPLYMSPEIIAGGDGGSPADIWALGCAVVEMVAGMPAWQFSPESDVSTLFYRIGVAGESPVIPDSLCCDGKDFLNKCFVKDPKQRWTARMLLDHPFLFGLDGPNYSGYEPAVSPRCPFEFQEWNNINSSKVSSSSSSYSSEGQESSFDWEKLLVGSELSNWSSISSRFGELVSDDRVVPGSVDSDSGSIEWVTVRWFDI